MRENPQIAIDGPAGVGKSTIGERVARRLGMLYVDTGAFYRALTLLALRAAIDPDDAEALTQLARNVAIRLTPPTVSDGRQYTVLVDGKDVTSELRTPAVEAAVSRVSRHPTVRATLIERMREMADALSVVMVGRDIGTVVLPEADLKICLMTSIETRAQRRYSDLVAQLGPEAPTFDEVRDEMARRDAKDAAQMRIASDAVVIHNDELEPEETVGRILALLEERQRVERDISDGGAQPVGKSPEVEP